MQTIEKLNLGYSDAQNYTQRGNKSMLSEVFVKNSYLDKMLNQSVYYVIGEKGTGKTAYAVYLCNSEYRNTKSVLKFISSTDYEKFHALKKAHRLDVSGYVDIWKTILLLLVAKNITKNEESSSIFNKNNLEKLMQAVDEYYNNAFSPEINTALRIIDESGVAAKIISNYLDLGGNASRIKEYTEQRLQMNLYYICKKFSECISKIKLEKNITLFIDGIDIRPSQIPYDEYLECIKGLANATWGLNTELFANVRDSKGQIKIVLLLRPDIFYSLNLQNSSNKLSDNSVYLDWRTTYTDYRNSNLFKMANRLLMYSQENQDKNNDNIWDEYFDWELPSSNNNIREKDDPFMEFLKISLSRPRDIQRILAIQQSLMVDSGLGTKNSFRYSVFNSDLFQNHYSEYFLSSLKDQLAFYYSDEDFEHFKKFFDFFDNPTFSYQEYKMAFDKFEDYIYNNANNVPRFAEAPKVFLQLLYDCNLIVAIETIHDNSYYHFSYREKSPSNISPKVPVGDNINYRFHYGLYKRAHLGRYN